MGQQRQAQSADIKSSGGIEISGVEFNVEEFHKKEEGLMCRQSDESGLRRCLLTQISFTAAGKSMPSQVNREKQGMKRQRPVVYCFPVKKRCLRYYRFMTLKYRFAPSPIDNCPCYLQL